MNFDDMEMTAIWNEIDEKLNEEPRPIEGMNYNVLIRSFW